MVATKTKKVIRKENTKAPAPSWCEADISRAVEVLQISTQQLRRCIRPFDTTQLVGERRMQKVSTWYVRTPYGAVVHVASWTQVEAVLLETQRQGHGSALILGVAGPRASAVRFKAVLLAKHPNGERRQPVWKCLFKGRLSCSDWTPAIQPELPSSDTTEAGKTAPFMQTPAEPKQSPSKPLARVSGASE